MAKNPKKARNPMINLIVLDSVDSTNNYLKQNCERLPDKTAVIALEQTEGRGRLGRAWERTDGCLYLSLLLKTGEIRGDLTLACALAVSDALDAAFQVKTDIKWPNDILLHGKKLCGILVENIIGESSRAVVGIGINLNNEGFPGSIAGKAASVFMETGRKCDVIKTGEAVAKEVIKRHSESASQIIGDYSKRCITLGNSVLAQGNNGEIEGTAASVNADGSLLVETKNGQICIYSGEVTLTGIN